MVGSVVNPLGGEKGYNDTIKPMSMGWCGIEVVKRRHFVKREGLGVFGFGDFCMVFLIRCCCGYNLR